MKTTTKPDYITLQVDTKNNKPMTLIWYEWIRKRNVFGGMMQRKEILGATRVYFGQISK